MCGITGQWMLRQPITDTTAVGRASDCLKHRGPDERAYFFASKNGYTSGRVLNAGLEEPQFNLAFGHCRLAIIDLLNGQQPMTNEDGSIWITYNGEVYNFPELKTLLQSRGHSFRTRSDTEAIVHLYEEFGVECVSYLRGEFSFAIWDNRQQELFLARDRVGVKPLYYFFDQEQFAFASELKAVLAYPRIPRELDLLALQAYLTYHYIPSPQTIFQHIYKLPPAHWLKLSASGSLQIQRYWQISFESKDTTEHSEAYYVEQLREVIHDAVQVQLISDVPLGAFLSGGIDSNTVVALMSQVSSKPVETFTIGFPGTSISEINLARQTAARYHTNHHEYQVTPHFLDDLPALVTQFDEPLGDSSLLPTFYVSQIARQHVTVALSGDGGDEGHAGYSQYPYNLQLQKFDAIPLPVRRILFGSLAHILPQGMKGKNYLRRLGLASVDRYLDFIGCLTPLELNQIWAADLRTSLTEEAGEMIRHLWETASSMDSLSQMQYVDIHSYLSEDVLVKVDRVSMLNSLEVRVPLLDHKVLEFAAKIPSHLRRKDGRGKYILRQAMADLLPKDILNNRKQGFGAPIQQWFQHELRQFARETLLDGHTKKRGLFNVSYLEQLLSQHEQGKVDRSRQLWSLLMLELWCRSYLDRKMVLA